MMEVMGLLMATLKTPPVAAVLLMAVATVIALTFLNALDAEKHRPVPTTAAVPQKVETVKVLVRTEPVHGTGVAVEVAQRGVVWRNKTKKTLQLREQSGVFAVTLPPGGEYQLTMLVPGTYTVKATDLNGEVAWEGKVYVEKPKK